jgi:anti-sigma factor RsiW
MNCADMAEILTGLADGRATAAERGRAQSHLASCARCRAEERWQKALKASVTSLEAPRMPADLKAALMGRAREAARTKRRRVWKERWQSWVRPAAGFGLAAGVATAAFLLVPRHNGEVAAPAAQTVAMDDLLDAHRAYAATLPLASREVELVLAAGRKP